MADIHAERSKFLNAQKKERTELEKSVKKLKGARKEEAEQKLNDLLGEQAEALKAFDVEHGLAAASAISTAADDKPEKEEKDKKEKKEKKEKKKKRDEEVDEADLVVERNWGGLSKKDLEQECSLRDISKKGGKEDLVMRLTLWVQEKKAELQQQPKAPEVGVEPAPEKEKKDKSRKKVKEEEQEEIDDDESSASERSDDEDNDGAAEDDDSNSETSESSEPSVDMDREEMEKQGKREKIVQKAIMFVLQQKKPDGFHLDELPAVLAEVKVNNFTPQMCGYTSLHDFARKQPREVFFYDKKSKMCFRNKFAQPGDSVPQGGGGGAPGGAAKGRKLNKVNYDRSKKMAH